MQQQRIQGVTVGPVEDLQAMATAITAFQMRPIIDRVFPFQDSKKAFDYMSAGKHFGKITIAID